MSTPPRPATLKSLPGTSTGSRAAEPARAASGGSAPKDAARQGVLTAPRPGQHWDDGRFVVACLHVIAPRGAVPTATSKCACGRDRSAIGRQNVRDLVQEHDRHPENCPLRTTQERDAA